MRIQCLLPYVVLVLAAIGCSESSARPGLFAQDDTGKVGPIDIARIEIDIMTFADNYVGSISSAIEKVQRQATSPEIRQVALSVRLGAARGAYSNAINPRPLAGLADMVVLVSLQRQSSEDPWFAQTFGPAGDPVRALLVRHEAESWAMAGRYLTAGHLDELRAAIAHWRRENPGQLRVASVRLLDLPEAKQARSGRARPGSVFDVLFLDPMSGVAPAVREMEQTRATASRMFFYLQRMPEMLRWETELMYLDMLGASEAQNTLKNLDTFTSNTTRFTEACKEVAAAVGRFSKELTVEREKTIVQLDSVVAKQRDAAINDVANATAKQRDAAVTQVATATAKERDAALKQIQGIVEQERKRIIDDGFASISRERDSAVKQIASAVRDEQKVILAEFESVSQRLIDRLAWRLGLATAASGAVIALIVLACRWLGPRRSVKIPEEPAVG